MSTQTATCIECSTSFTYEIRDTLSPAWQRLLIDKNTTCPTCAQRAREQQDAQDRADREAEINLLHQQRIASSGVADLGDYTAVDNHATRAADAWAHGHGNPLLVLTGPVGTGKSTLAAVAFRWRLRPRHTTDGIGGRRGYWRSAPQLLNHLSAGFGNPRHDAAIALLDGTYMLGIDDLDKVRPSDYVAQHIFAAIDGCWANRTPLIVTTNYSLGQLEQHWPEQYAEPIVSRLASGNVVQLTGDDRRLRRAA